ncbi:MAG: hypothetical protein HQL08_06415 [Nitrospirae bacterium]|nr:hypothetical protein [Nitrospirota bacterium]
MTNKRLLFPIDRKEFDANQGRLLRLVRILSDDGYKVDIMTPNEEVRAKAAEAFKGSEKVDVLFVRPDVIALPGSFKDDLAKTFIRQTHNMTIPETDMKMYKLSALDDFFGYIVDDTYPDIDITPYDLVLMPVLSRDDFPQLGSDCFYSVICFLAKEKKVRLLGLQTRPAVQNVFLYAKIMDFIVVKEDWERKYLEQLGIEKERIFHLTDPVEAYCLKSIEDSYMNDLFEFMADKYINMDKRAFCIVIFNHPNYRSEIKEILSVIWQLDLPVVVILIKFGYNVRELEEQGVIELVYKDIIDKIKGGVFFVEANARNRLMFLLLSDMTISSSYQEMLGFAAGHKKTAVVYNSIFRDMATDDGVVFMDRPDELKNMILKCFNEKKTGYNCLADIVGKLCNNSRR